MERKRMTMGEAAQIRYKSALPPTVYYPPLATQRDSSGTLSVAGNLPKAFFIIGKEL